jgi:hypothetical protein
MKIQLTIKITDEGGNDHETYRNLQYDPEDLRNEDFVEESLGETSADMVDTIMSNICEWCNGEGEITTMEQVYAGEPHTAPIGTRKCICTKE